MSEPSIFLFQPGDHVAIRGTDIIGVIIQTLLTGIPISVQYKIVWFTNGTHNAEWFSDFQLTAVKADTIPLEFGFHKL